VTFVLSFSNGETIETTAEHPFYVDGKGFVPAGELGIGTSIVTRAGPSLRLHAADSHRRQSTVYNLEVEDFHTYFVGKAKLWVHNLDCSHVWPDAKEMADNVQGLAGNERPSSAGAIRLPGDFHSHVGVNSKNQPNWTVHTEVEKLYNDPNIVPPGTAAGSHLQCAEVSILSEIFSQNLPQNYTPADVERVKAKLQGAVSFTVRVRGKNSPHPEHHGSALPACDSCKQVLERLHITDLAENIDWDPYPGYGS